MQSKRLKNKSYFCLTKWYLFHLTTFTSFDYKFLDRSKPESTLYLPWWIGQIFKLWWNKTNFFNIIGVCSMFQNPGQIRSAWTFNTARIIIFVTQDRTQHRVKTKLRDKQILRQKFKRSLSLSSHMVLSPYFPQKEKGRIAIKLIIFCD